MKLYLAAKKGDIKSIIDLLEHGAKINDKDYKGRAALHIAVSNSQLEIVQVLLKYGADTEIKNNYGETALHLAAENGELEIVQALLAHGANIKAKNDKGETVLYFAAMSGRADLVKTLLEHGVDAVRIQTPIPSADTVCIEVPNEKRQLVSFKEIIEHENFVNSKSKLTLGLGRDISGSPVSVKMDDMPHLLIAGAKETGKTVCLNSIILSILYKAQPHEVQMLLIDPKGIEFSLYNGLPHLVHPVVTDMDLACNALLWAVDEMDQRFKLFQNLGLRNIIAYNKFVQKNARKEQNTKLTELPFIVIIVDELADLMMLKGKDAEEQLIRLGQLARAAGIHIILATQHLSEDIITELIKNNFPAHIAFQVSSTVDSQIILDSPGAEALPSKGYMIFKPRSGDLQHIHGAFVTEDEVRAVTNFWKKQASPNYKIDFTQYGEAASEQNFDDEDTEYDEMYDTIVDWITEQDAVSISMLQRKFRLGFSRAGHIIDRLEMDGYIEPRSDSKPRKVIH